MKLTLSQNIVLALLVFIFFLHSRESHKIYDIIQETNMESEPKNETEQVHDLNNIYAAIAKVESNGLFRRGKTGEIGIYQITEAYWKDSGVAGEFEMCWNDIYSRVIMLNYWRRYCPMVSPLTNFEALARVHNGGPDGWRDDPEWFVRNRGYTLEKAEAKIRNTQEYWGKVKAAMEGSK
ncbi:MAG TPA: hypothetical protein ENH94_06965 [Phycisphaerales bacterium]|nr:hypothetical protein [Phycisphaerales bacterium]